MFSIGLLLDGRPQKCRHRFALQTYGILQETQFVAEIEDSAHWLTATQILTWPAASWMNASKSAFVPCPFAHGATSRT